MLSFDVADRTAFPTPSTLPTPTTLLSPTSASLFPPSLPFDSGPDDLQHHELRLGLLGFSSSPTTGSPTVYAMSSHGKRTGMKGGTAQFAMMIILMILVSACIPGILVHLFYSRRIDEHDANANNQLELRSIVGGGVSDSAVPSADGAGEREELPSAIRSGSGSAGPDGYELVGSGQ
ncbi:hypothetical protein AAMO2058_001004300 [Amorphochlora amoebiformis]